MRISQLQQVNKCRHSKSHAFRVRLTHLGVFLWSHAVRHHFSRILQFLAKFMKICPNAISQEPEEPQKSMTYQNACTKCRKFISGVSFGPIPKDFYRFLNIYLGGFDDI